MKTRRFAKAVLFTIMAGRCFGALAPDPAANIRDRSFDFGWRFLRADAPGAEAPGFDEKAWRTLDVPYDWSIEDLPPLEKPPAPELPVTAGQWRFQKGDEPAWKAREFDDSNWQSVALPDTWEHHSDYTDDNVYGWFRRRIEIPADCRGQDFDLLLGRIDDVDEAWLNGESIGGTGSFPPDFRSAWNVQRRYRVPASLVRGDGSDVLAVRVFDQGGNGGIYEAGIRSVRVGPFDPGQSKGGASTGHVLGGTGWYRKHFTLTPAESHKLIAVRFDGSLPAGNIPHRRRPVMSVSWLPMEVLSGVSLPFLSRQLTRPAVAVPNLTGPEPTSLRMEARPRPARFVAAECRRTPPPLPCFLGRGSACG